MLLKVFFAVRLAALLIYLLTLFFAHPLVLLAALLIMLLKVFFAVRLAALLIYLLKVFFARSLSRLPREALGSARVLNILLGELGALLARLTSAAIFLVACLILCPVSPTRRIFQTLLDFTPVGILPAPTLTDHAPGRGSLLIPEELPLPRGA